MDCVDRQRCYVAIEAGSSGKGVCLTPNPQCPPPFYCPCPGTPIQVCDAPPGYQNVPMGRGNAPACSKNSDCAPPTRCYFGITEGCSATGACLTPVAGGTACEAVSYCDCQGNMVGDCNSPAFYQDVPVAGYTCTDAAVAPIDAGKDY
jgi:hypothetical protein